jgi:ribosomal protein S27AE
VSALPCPNCGSELAFLAQYQRHYCYTCSLYAPEGFGDRGAKRCPTCTGILSYVAQYDRYYCYRCNAYPPEGADLAASPSVSEPSHDLATASPTALVVIAPTKPAEPWPSIASVEPAAADERPTGEEIPGDDTPPSRAKRSLDREEISTARKPLLTQLCKDYDLDDTGTREELRQRLLNYLDELEGETKPEVEEDTTGGTWEQLPLVSETAEPESTEPTAAAMGSERPIESSDSMVAEEPPKEIPSTPRDATPTASTAYPVQPVATPFVPTRATVSSSREPPAYEIPSVPVAKAEHPCPTCGRELAYIARYDRWYCYSCRAYAPRTRAKFACPNCGVSLRWITQYERWWCDACRRYAPADLPKPERLVGATLAVQADASRTAATAAVVVHRHQSPGSGIGLLTFGLLLFVVYEILVDLPIVLRVNTGLDIAPDVAFGLRFFAFLFVAAGALLGLSAVRDRR